jgi:hypothetical protein
VPVIPALRRWRKEAPESEASPGYIVRSCPFHLCAHVWCLSCNDSVKALSLENRTSLIYLVTRFVYKFFDSCYLVSLGSENTTGETLSSLLHSHSFPRPCYLSSRFLEFQSDLLLVHEFSTSLGCYLKSFL